MPVFYDELDELEAEQIELDKAESAEVVSADKPYRAGYEFAVQIRNRLLEDILMKRAIEGHDEIKIVSTLVTDANGNVIAEIPTEKVSVRKIDNALALRLLAANDGRYNPKKKIEIEDRSKKSIAEILADARKRLAGGEEPNGESEADTNTGA
jgi:vacuolar-type H+-ATPase subunit I/STV1